MKIKEEFFQNKKKSAKIKEYFLTKSRIFKILAIILILCLGILIGLFAGGFFGTLNSPSPQFVNFLHSIGIDNLQNKKMIFQENLKIPYNYAIGQFSNPKKLYIDISFDNYQKIIDKRREALKLGVLITSGEDYVPAKISFEDKNNLDVKLRLKGDWTDHLEGDKWSFRIQIKGNDSIEGMRIFSIQDPETRRYLNEKIYQELLKEEGLISLRYEFVEVFINGDRKGIYALEEHFEKQLIENNNRREGVIVKFSEDFFWKTISQGGIVSNNEMFEESYVDKFDNKLLEDPLLKMQFEKAVSLLESFKRDDIGLSQAFDTDLLAKYFAINTLLGAEHASEWNNIRFYYNPITSRLEPVGFDAYAGSSSKEVFSHYVYSDENSSLFYHKIFSDREFFEKYIENLQRMSEEAYLKSFFEPRNQEFKNYARTIYKDAPYYHFDLEVFYRNQEEIKEALGVKPDVQAFIQYRDINQGKINLAVSNQGYKSVEITGLEHNGSIFRAENNEILPNRFKERYTLIQIPISREALLENNPVINITYNLKGGSTIFYSEVHSWPVIYEGVSEETIRATSDFNESWIEKQGKTIIIKSGNWEVNKDLIFPKEHIIEIEEGTTINLMNHAIIISYSPVYIKGKPNKPVLIHSRDNTGGIVILNAGQISNFNYVRFSNLTNPSKEGWELTGAITIYNSPFKFNNVIIENMHSEDSLNGVASHYEIKNSIFKNCFSDCFDDDFLGGLIDSTKFINCGNDCMDFSGALVNISNIQIFGSGDKGVSSGEKSDVFADNLLIEDAYIGIASKDFSLFTLKNVKITNCTYGVVAYQKKAEYGPGIINAINLSVENTQKNYLIEKKSTYRLDDTIILENAEEVYSKLYDVEPGQN